MNPPFCRTCGAPIPDELISCRACALRKSREMVLAQQKEYLPEVLNSVRELTLSRPAPQPRWHILLTGVREHTFCGVIAHSSWRRRIRFIELPNMAVCGSCHDTLQRLAGEIASAEVR